MTVPAVPAVPAVRVEVRRRRGTEPEQVEVLRAVGAVAAKLPTPEVSPALMANLKALGQGIGAAEPACSPPSVARG